MTDVRAARPVSPCTVYHTPGTVVEVSGLPGVRLRDAADVFAQTRFPGHGAVLIVDASLLHRARRLATLPPHVILVAADAASEETLGPRADLSLNALPDATGRRRTLRAACQLSTARVAAAVRRRQLICTRRDLHELNEIGIDLMQQRDQEVLLRRIVQQGKYLTESDGGCLFLLEHDRRDVPRLRPAVFGSDSLPDLPAIPVVESLPVDNTSIIGHAAVSKQQVVIRDAYALAPDQGFSSNVDFERAFGYYVKSMLVVPMLDRREQVMGVLAFVNRTRDRGIRIINKEAADQNVLSYTRREIRLGRALASIAATSIENTSLHARIEHLLESFVKAAASAIDQRDPSTAGHSTRVATLTTELAQAVERGGNGSYRDLRFTRAQMRELRYAALLHDLGKVTVREDVLMKAKKLPPELWERVQARFDLIRRTLEVEHYKTCGVSSSDEKTPGHEHQLDAVCGERRAELERLWDLVRAANEPAPLTCSPADLDDIALRLFEGPNHSPTHYLTTDELRYLQIPHGTLNDHERGEIQSHVEQTYQFLLQIPWTADLKNLARYARGHHEKLDGSGYPLGLKGVDIPVQTRLMTIADIFDALTAADRPYKQAVPVEKALEIIQDEAKAGLLDTELVRVLIESQVYRQILPH